MLSPLFILPFLLVGGLCQSTGQLSGETEQVSGGTEAAGTTAPRSEGTAGPAGSTEGGSEGTGITEQPVEGSSKAPGGTSEQPGGGSVPAVPGSCSELKCRNGFHCVVQSAFCWIGTFCTEPQPTCVPTCRDPNEIWDSCPSCVSNYLCGQGLPICLEAPLPCQPRCVCKDGWVRNVDGACIAIWKCLSNMGNVAGGLPAGLAAGQGGGETGGPTESGGTTVRGARSSSAAA